MADHTEIVARTLSKMLTTQRHPHDRRNIKMRNLFLIRNGYKNYLERILRFGAAAPGVPIIIADDLRFTHACIGPEDFDRSWFEPQVPGGTHTVWVSKGDGFQWWIMTWTWKDNLIRIQVSHWVIDHDEVLKRNTIYLSRTYLFTERTIDDTQSMTPDMIVMCEGMRCVPKTHKELTFKNAKHALRHEKEQWPLVLAPYGMFSVRKRIDSLVRRFDFSGIIPAWLDRQFKMEWSRRVLHAMYPAKTGRTIRKINDEGFLLDLWYHPHPSYEKDIEKHKEDWDKVVAAYDDWQQRFYDAMHGKGARIDNLPEFPPRFGTAPRGNGIPKSDT